MHDTFIQAIHDRRRVRLTFYSKQDRGILVRTCAPMDYGPSRRAHDKSPRYHFWDIDSDTRVHTLSLLPNQIVSVETLSETFDPAHFITWSTAASPWFVPRDWGPLS